MSAQSSPDGTEPTNVPLPGQKKPGRRLSPEAMSAKFQAFVAQEEGLPEERVRVEGLRRLAGGSSRLLWSADVAIERDAEPSSLQLVLRQDPPGRIAEGRMGLEFELLKAAASEGVPVPRVYWCDPASGALGTPFFAMDRLEGETIPRRLLRDERYASARSELCGQLGEALARIHAIGVEGASWAGALPRPAGGDDPALSEIDQVAAGYRAFAVEPHPVLELAERWLRANVPRTGSLGLVHGDFRLGNFMFDESGLVAILDWELAHLGDPAEDLAWFCVRAWRFGADHLPAGGLASREELLAGYRAAGGAPIDPAALHFWEVLGNFKLALVFITQARAYLDGAHATVELASLGRRIAEPEAELLALMEEAG